MPALSSYHQYRRTDNATLIASDLRTGKTAYGPNGLVTGAGYFPAMMKFDGTTGFYNSGVITTSGNVVTMVVRFKVGAIGDGDNHYMFMINGAVGVHRCVLWVDGDSHATADRRGRLIFNCRTAASTSIAFLASNIAVTDNVVHEALGAYNATTGAAVLLLDGVNVDNGSFSQRVLTTGTLAVGASSRADVGANGSIPNRYFPGHIGRVGYRDVHITDQTLFVHPDGSPKNIESTLNTVWGGPPAFWHESAKMDESVGSAGVMTKNGSIILAPASAWS